MKRTLTSFNRVINYTQKKAIIDSKNKAIALTVEGDRIISINFDSFQ